MERRQFLKSIAALPATAAAAGCASDTMAVAAFTHGVASGDPLADRVMLWTRAVPLTADESSVAVDWAVARDPAFADIIATGTARAEAARDFTVKVDAAGLQPDTRYYYRFSAGGAQSPVGRTRTSPIGQAAALKLAVVSCSNLPWGYFNGYRALAQQDDIAAIVHLGDYIYEYPRGKYASPAMEAEGRLVEPAGETIVLGDYRQRYSVYRRDPDLQAAHAAHPMIAVWDDHESTNDGWMEGAENHNDGEGDWEDRKAASRQAWLEWLPVREDALIAAGKIYRSFNFGDLARLIMLDTRLVGRDAPLDYRRDLTLDPKADAATQQAAADAFKASRLHDPARSLLGWEQETWLRDQFKASKAAGQPWQILGQQVIVGTLRTPTDIAALVDPEKPGLASIEALHYFGLLSRLGLPFNLDAWDGYGAARTRLLADALAHADNVITLSGDSHNAWAFRLTHEGQLAAADIATHSISSPGMEYYLNAPPARLAQALIDANADLIWADTQHRGYMIVDLTPDKLQATWWALRSVTEKSVEQRALKSLIVHPSDRPGLGDIVALG